VCKIVEAKKSHFAFLYLSYTHLSLNTPEGHCFVDKFLGFF
jgi:hypothetical protein